MDAERFPILWKGKIRTCGPWCSSMCIHFKKEESLICTQDTQTASHTCSAENNSSTIRTWLYHNNSAVTTMEDVITRTDPRNELIGLHSPCFLKKESFIALLTCPQGPKCTQPLTSQLGNGCNLFFCQTIPTSGDKTEKARQACCMFQFTF